MPGKSIESGSTRIPFETRFWHFAMPEPNSGCWIWMGHVSPNGYAKSKFGYKSDGTRRTDTVHRQAYEYFVGPIPQGMDLDHRCRLRCCVNPDHLEPVTRSVNNKRGLLSALRPIRTHCKHGHALLPENVFFLKDRAGAMCRTCRRQRQLAYVEKMKCH
jgi:hypothetical protein